MLSKFILLFMLLLPINAYATERTAATCEQTAFETVLAVSISGDIINIPSGICHWSHETAVNIDINIIGAGIGFTNIIDDFNYTSTPGGRILVWTTSDGQSDRLSGITFDHSSLPVAQTGSIQIYGSSKALRIDHCHFTTSNVMFRIDGYIFGVIDHNVFDMVNNSVANAFSVGHSNWNGHFYGDGSWADDDYWGTNKAIYVEDNEFNGFNTYSYTAIPAADDLNDGGRLVFRFNTLTNVFFQGHEMAIRNTGARLAEVYANTFNWTDPDMTGGAVPFTMFWRTGTFKYWGNESTGYVNLINGVNDRYTRPDLFAGATFWQMCGTNKFNGIDGGPSNWDQNADVPTGYACMEMIGRGRGDLLSGDAPTPVWLNQVLDPAYMWMNTFHRPPFYTNQLFSGQLPIVLDRDVYQEAVDGSFVPNFNATTGTGFGSRTTMDGLASTCVNSVGYFVISGSDLGTWNAGTNNKYTGQGRFYKCVSNAWVLDYTPYTYPHPLINESTAEIISVTPTFGLQGQLVSLEIVGLNTLWVQDNTQASFSGGLLIPTSTTVNSHTSATVVLPIGAAIAPGAYDVIMTTITP